MATGLKLLTSWFSKMALYPLANTEINTRVEEFNISFNVFGKQGTFEGMGAAHEAKKTKKHQKQTRRKRVHGGRTQEHQKITK